MLHLDISSSFVQTTARNLHKRWRRFAADYVSWGFLFFPVEICITEITEGKYKEKEKKWTVVVVGHHLDGHTLVKRGGHLLQITLGGQMEARLCCLRRHYAGGHLRGLGLQAWARHRALAVPCSLPSQTPQGCVVWLGSLGPEGVADELWLMSAGWGSCYKSSVPQQPPSAALVRSLASWVTSSFTGRRALCNARLSVKAFTVTVT